MLLALAEAERFFELHRTLMWFVNERLAIVPNVDSPDAIAALPPQTRLEIRNAFLNHTELLQTFTEENPAGLSPDELEIVRSWRHQIAGRFFIFRYLKKYAVFLSTSGPSTAYGVLALTEPFEQVVGPGLPVMVDTVLLPLGDKIVYDGLLSGHNITFGGGIRRMLNETYKEAKERMGIVTSLPVGAQPASPGKKTRPAKATSTGKATGPAQPFLDVIVRMTDEFCHQRLNEEYAELCRKLAEKLARKRPSPLLSGKPATWASAIVRTIGWVNFLHDPDSQPYMALKDIDEAFGISPSTGQAKLKTIRSALRIRQLDPAWTLPSRRNENPFGWML